MTVTPTHRAARRRRLRALLTTVVAVALLSPLGAPPASGADATAPTPSPSPTATGIVEFTLSPVENGVVRAGDALTASLTIQNGTDADLPATSVSLALGATALGDRSALSTWLGGDLAGTSVVEVATAEFPAVTAGSEETVGIMVDPTSPALAGRAPGVYPLLATYLGESGPLPSTSAMTVPDDAAAPTGVGVIVPITAKPLSDALLTPAELTLLTAPEGALTEVLDAVEGTAAILAVDPAIPAAIRVLGTRAPTPAAAWLERLERLPNSRFALQFGDADVAVQLAAGKPRPIGPTSLQFAMRPAGFPTATPSPQPTPTATPTAPPPAVVFPALSELLDIGGATPAIYWPAPGTTSAGAVAALGAVTVDDAPSFTLVPSTATTAGASGATVTARRTAGEAGVLVYDAGISRVLEEASRLDDSLLRGAPRAAATAYLAFATKDAAGAPLLVTLDRDDERSRIAIATTLMTALQSPATVPLTLDEIIDAPPAAIDLIESTPDPSRTSAATTFFAEEQSIAEFATILDDPSLLTGPERAEILQLLAVSWTTDASAWAQAVQDHQAQTATTLQAVGLLPVGDIQQIGPSADIPVWVHNDLPYDVSVVLSATPNDLRLDVEPSIPVIARAQGNTRVLIPVHAQIGSGDVEIALQLRSRTLEQIGAPQLAKVTVRADWERYGVIALIAIVGLLLVVGVVRTVRRRRRSRREDSPAAADAPPSTSHSGAASDPAADDAGSAPVPDQPRA